MPDSTVKVNNTFGKIVLKSHLADSTLDGVEATLKSLNDLHQFDPDLTVTTNSISSSSNSDENSVALGSPPSDSISLGLFSDSSPSPLPTTTTTGRYFFDNTSSLGKSSGLLASSRPSLLSPPAMPPSSSNLTHPTTTRDAMLAAKWTSFDNVFECTNLSSNPLPTSNTTTQNPIESGYATVRKYQPNYRNNINNSSNENVCMRRQANTKPYTINSG